MASSVAPRIFMNEINCSSLSSRAEKLVQEKTRFTDYLPPEIWPFCRPGFQERMRPLSEQAKTDLIAQVFEKTIANCRVLELIPKNHDSLSDKIILYIHGGAFTLGSPDCQMQIPAPLAAITGWRVLAVDYPLAPYPEKEDPHPAHTAVFNVYQELVKDSSSKEIVFLGDSAGGNIAFGVALLAKDQNVALPGAIITYAPWVDLEQKTKTYFDQQRIAQTVVLTPDSLRSARDAAFGEQKEYSSYVSPIHGDYEGFSDVAVAIYTAGRDLLRDEGIELAHRLAKKAKAVDTFYKEGTWHGYQEDYPLDEAEECAKRAANFLFKYLS